MKSQFKKSISLICVLLLIVSALSLSACGQGSKSIVGTWVGSFPACSSVWHPAYVNRIVFYEDGSLTFVCDVFADDSYYGQTDVEGTYTIFRDGTAVELNPTSDNWFCTMTMDYKLVSNDRLVLYINGSEYTLQREK